MWFLHAALCVCGQLTVGKNKTHTHTHTHTYTHTRTLSREVITDFSASDFAISQKSLRRQCTETRRSDCNKRRAVWLG